MHPEVNGELARPIASRASGAEYVDHPGMTVGDGREQLCRDDYCIVTGGAETPSTARLGREVSGPRRRPR